MKLLVWLFVVAGFCWLTGCEEDVNSPAQSIEPGSISGTVLLDPDVQGTVEGTTVHMYASKEDAMNARQMASAVADKDGRFEFTSIYPGTYYFHLSKDNDCDGVIDRGDFCSRGSGCEPCCCDVSSCNMTTVNLCVYVIP